MGGISSGFLLREEYAGRKANILQGKVSLANSGGFIQMATSLVGNDLGETSVDASKFEGIELDVYNGIACDAGFENFNIQ
jgi:Complex I intermediate-associated protein 30 (CIA30)